MPTVKKKKKPSTKVQQKMQYSKKIAGWVTAFWMIIRLFCAWAITYHPASASALTEYVAGVDSVMMVNLGFYAGNSVAEKGIVGYFYGNRNRSSSDDDGEVEETEDDKEEYG